MCRLAISLACSIIACQAVTAAHGIRGEVKVKTFTETPDNLAAYGALTTEDGRRRVQDAIDRYYTDSGGRSATAGMDAADEDDLEHLRDMASEAPVIRLVNAMIAQAVEKRASDIHIEPFEKEFRLRFRIDGVLVNQEPPPRELKAAIISRVKLMARLNIAERRLPQDGRIQLKILGREVDLRVSTLPTLHGEKVVMRLLDKENLRLDMTKLGFEPMLSHNLQAPIIVTFCTPADPNYDFEKFYDALRVRGYAIYPGKLTKADSFRIGCIGRIDADHMRGALAAIREILAEMGADRLAPKEAA